MKLEKREKIKIKRKDGKGGRSVGGRKIIQRKRRKERERSGSFG